MFENHTGSSRTVASSWLLPRPGQPRARESGFRGEGTDRSTKTWNHLETMPEGIDQALAKSGQSWPIYLNSKPAMGTSTHTKKIPYLSENRFLSLSPKKPHPQNVSPGLLHPTRSHLHPCLKITPVRHQPLRVGGCSPAAGRPRARESGFKGEGTDRSTKTWNHLETMPEGVDQALAKSGQSWPIYLNPKPAMGTSHPYYKYPI